MAIHGLNFGGGEIPAPFKRRFAARISLEKSVKGRTTKWLRLQGVATSEEEKDQMLGAVVRPGREVRVEKRLSAGGWWFGIYVY